MINVNQRKIEFKKVKGHSKDKLNEYVDYLTWFKHKYQHTTLKIKGTTFKSMMSPTIDYMMLCRVLKKILYMLKSLKISYIY